MGMPSIDSFNINIVDDISHISQNSYPPSRTSYPKKTSPNFAEKSTLLEAIPGFRHKGHLPPYPDGSHRILSADPRGKKGQRPWQGHGMWE